MRLRYLPILLLAAYLLTQCRSLLGGEPDARDSRPSMDLSMAGTSADHGPRVHT